MVLLNTVGQITVPLRLANDCPASLAHHGDGTAASVTRVALRKVKGCSAKGTPILNFVHGAADEQGLNPEISD